jgi:hypothetical protein
MAEEPVRLLVTSVVVCMLADCDIIVPRSGAEALPPSNTRQSVTVWSTWHRPPVKPASMYDSVFPSVW